MSPSSTQRLHARPHVLYLGVQGDSLARILVVPTTVDPSRIFSLSSEFDSAPARMHKARPYLFYTCYTGDAGRPGRRGRPCHSAHSCALGRQNSEHPAAGCTAVSHRSVYSINTNCPGGVVLGHARVGSQPPPTTATPPPAAVRRRIKPFQVAGALAVATFFSPYGSGWRSVRSARMPRATAPGPRHPSSKTRRALRERRQDRGPGLFGLRAWSW